MAETCYSKDSAHVSVFRSISEIFRIPCSINFSMILAERGFLISHSTWISLIVVAWIHSIFSLCFDAVRRSFFLSWPSWYSPRARHNPLLLILMDLHQTTATATGDWRRKRSEKTNESIKSSTPQCRFVEFSHRSTTDRFHWADGYDSRILYFLTKSNTIQSSHIYIYICSVIS